MRILIEFLKNVALIKYNLAYNHETTNTGHSFLSKYVHDKSQKKTHTHTNLGVCQPYTLKQQSNSYLCTEYLVFKIKKAEQ